MKKFLLSSFTLLALCTPVLNAQNTEGGDVIFDLTTSSAFNKCSQTSYRYNHGSYPAFTFYTYYSCVQMYNYSVSEPNYDDILFTPELELKQGHLYRVTTAPAAYTSGKTTNLHVYYGQGAPSDYSENNEFEANYNLLASYTDLPYVNVSYSSQAEDRAVEFTVPADGKYRIAFRGEPNRMNLFRTKIIEFGPSDIPAAVNDLAVLPDADGANTVEISFTLPSETITGQSLADATLSYTLLRDDDTIDAGSKNGGEAVSFTDDQVSAGEHTYTLEVSNGDNKTTLSVSTFVGAETPTEATDVVLSGAEGAYKITWKAPTSGVHGATLSQEKIKYQIKRFVGENSEVLTSDHSSTEYTDDFSSSELAALCYEITVVYGSETSEGAKSNVIKAGSLNLPFADSFAGAVIDDLKWEIETVAGTSANNKWQAAEQIWTGSASATKYNSVDDDGGLAFVDFWYISSGNSSRLETMPLSVESATAPVVDFWLWRSNNGNDNIQLQIQIDNNDWQDIEGAVYQNKPDPNAEDAAVGWFNYKLGFGTYITEGAKTFRIGFTANSKNGYNMAIDAVRIFNVSGADLEVASLSAPETILAGNDLTLTLKIANNGGDVSAGDYTINVETNFPTPVEFETVGISSLSYAVLTAVLPITAEEAFDLPEYTFTVEVVYEGDEEPDNNVSDEITVATAFSSLQKPGATTISSDESGNFTLEWESAKDLSYQPIDIAESFEDFDNNAEGPFNGFTIIDLDHNVGDANYATGMPASSKFIVVTPVVKATTSYNTGQYENVDGTKCLGLTSSTGTQNDWIISPELNCGKGENASLKLDFLVAFGKPSNPSSSYSYSYEVLYALDDYSEESPATSFVRVTSGSRSKYGTSAYDQNFEEISVTGIPGNAKYIAIHFNSTVNSGVRAHTVAVDNIRITEVDEAPLLGYHVYERNNGRINEEQIDINTLSHTFADRARASLTRSFYVTAIYNEGESEPSDLATISNEAGIENVFGNGSLIQAVNNGVLISGFDGLVANVYSLDGRLAASVKCSEATVVNLNSGLYVVKVGTEVAKVAVK